MDGNRTRRRQALRQGFNKEINWRSVVVPNCPLPDVEVQQRLEVLPSGVVTETPQFGQAGAARHKR